MSQVKIIKTQSHYSKKAQRQRAASHIETPQTDHNGKAIESATTTSFLILRQRAASLAKPRRLIAMDTPLNQQVSSP